MYILYILNEIILNEIILYHIILYYIILYYIILYYIYYIILYYNYNYIILYYIILYYIILYDRRKFRSETSDNVDSWKAEVRRVRREKIRRKKMQMRKKVGKSRNTVFFQWFVAPEGWKVGSLKRRVRSQLARWEMKSCTSLWRDVQSTPGSDHFWKLRCRKSARRFGAKYISKLKYTKYTLLGPLLEVAMSKKCTPLWREAHYQVKMYKAHQVRSTFGSWDVEKVHAVVARSTCQNVENTPFSDHFWKLRCRKSARRCGAKHMSKCTKHTRSGPLLEFEMSKKCTPLWREAHFQVKSVKNWRSQVSDHFWRFRCRKSVEKVHAVVVRSTFRS